MAILSGILTSESNVTPFYIWLSAYLVSGTNLRVDLGGDPRIVQSKGSGSACLRQYTDG